MRKCRIGTAKFFTLLLLLYRTSVEAQGLLDKFAGKGQMKGLCKEVVDFGKVIGEYVDKKTGVKTPTTWGTIHYGKKGAHIVPKYPEVIG